jgi:hypothetical protein
MALQETARLPKPDLRQVPGWVRRFYHPATLKEVLNLAAVSRQPGNEFIMACLLGILHHQRPGFLSDPSSHLVPYLRDRKYPRHRFRDTYALTGNPAVLASRSICRRRSSRHLVVEHQGDW